MRSRNEYTTTAVIKHFVGRDGFPDDKRNGYKIDFKPTDSKIS